MEDSWEGDGGEDQGWLHLWPSLRLKVLRWGMGETPPLPPLEPGPHTCRISSSALRVTGKADNARAWAKRSQSQQKPFGALVFRRTLGKCLPLCRHFPP